MPPQLSKIFCACFALSVSAQLFAQALPHGGAVVSGKAVIISPGNNLNIANTPGAVINWQSFNIGTGNTTQFIQQSASSMVYNRVTSGTPSSITGSMTPNGKVFAVNPNSAKAGGGAVTDIAASGSVPSNAFQIITSDGAHAFRSLPPPPNAATQAVIGADGVVRLTSAKP